MEIFTGPAVAQSPQPAVKTEGGIIGTDSHDIPFSAYSDVKGHAYTAEYFDFIGTTDLTSVAAIKSGISLIENFIKLQIEAGNLNDTVDSYQEVMKGLMKDIGLSKNMRNDHRFMELVNYIKLITKYNGHLPRTDSGTRPA